MTACATTSGTWNHDFRGWKIRTNRAWIDIFYDYRKTYDYYDDIETCSRRSRIWGGTLSLSLSLSLSLFNSMSIWYDNFLKIIQMENSPLLSKLWSNRPGSSKGIGWGLLEMMTWRVILTFLTSRLTKTAAGFWDTSITRNPFRIYWSWCESWCQSWLWLSVAENWTKPSIEMSIKTLTDLFVILFVLTCVSYRYGKSVCLVSRKRKRASHRILSSASRTTWSPWSSGASRYDFQ